MCGICGAVGYGCVFVLVLTAQLPQQIFPLADVM